MKNLFCYFMLLAAITVSSAQDKFEFNEKGLTDYVVVSIPGTPAELYQKTINWIKETYKNPDAVIQMQMENEKIRISGFKKDFNCATFGKQTACADATYTIEVSFKDGKYKFDPIDLATSNTAGKFNMPLNDGSYMYGKKIKPELREESIARITGLFDSLNLSLKNYIEGKSQDSKW